MAGTPFTDEDLAGCLEPLGTTGAEAARFISLCNAASAAYRGEALDETHLRWAVAFLRKRDLREGRESPNADWPEQLRALYIGKRCE